MKAQSRWVNRLTAMTLGLGLALSMLSLRHWYETVFFGRPLCENCGTDFPAIYAGARLVWENPTALYDLKQQALFEKAVDPRLDDSTLAFAYPPITALLLMPLGWTSFTGAYLLMSLVSGTALLISLKLLRESLQLNKQQFRWLKLTTVCNYGVHVTFVLGQTSLIILLIFSLLVAAAYQRDSIRSGIWSGALFLKPQLLVVPLLVLAVKRLWRALYMGLLVIGVSAVVSAFLVGEKGIADYIQIANRFSSAQSNLGTNPQDMHNLRALALFVFQAPFATYFWAVLFGLVLIVTALFNFRLPQNKAILSTQWIVNLLAALLLSPHLHAHDLSLLVIVSALILKNYESYQSWISMSVVLVLVAVSLFPLFPRIFEIHWPPPVLPMIFLAALFYYARSVFVSEPRNGSPG